jgi:AraC-like DNA-binding protein
VLRPLLSFLVVAREILDIPEDRIGLAWPLTNPFHPRQRHRHDELELNLITAGRARYALADRQYELTRRSLVWLFPGQEHLLVDCDRRFRAWIVVLRREPLVRLCDHGAYRILRAENPPGLFCRTLEADDSRHLEQLLARTLEARDDQPLHDAALGCAVLLAWSCFRRSAGPEQSRPLHPAVRKALTILQSETTEVSLSDLADRAGVSESYLSRTFKRELQLSLTDYRNRCRLERFFELRRTRGHENLLATALAAGFGSYPQFHRICRQITGRSPRDAV